MQALLAIVLSVFAVVAYAEQEELTEIAGATTTDKIVELDESGDSNNMETVRPTRNELQQKSVKMIVGGQSEDGVAREVLVAPKD